jgi:hypothetical protein
MRSKSTFSSKNHSSRGRPLGGKGDRKGGAVAYILPGFFKFSIDVGSPGFEVVWGCFPFSDIVEEDGCDGGGGNNNEVIALPKLKNDMMTVRISGARNKRFSRSE